MGFASRKVAAFLAELLTGIHIGGCSVFGPGIGGESRRVRRRDENCRF